MQTTDDALLAGVKDANSYPEQAFAKWRST
jgi:hypothetical protein